MKLPRQTEHRVLLQWLTGFSISVPVVYVAEREGLFGLLLSNDQSYLSIIILIAFALINLHLAYRVTVISRERNIADQARGMLEASNVISCDNRKLVLGSNQVLPPSFVSQHLKNLAARLDMEQPVSSNSKLQDHLMHVLEKRLLGPQKYGWMLADLMIKLGLVGTVIGFILMLGSVATLEHYDLETMQDLLRSMSGGMQVALFTTLTGLGTGLLLALQYQFLDQHSEALLADIEEITEIYVIPGLMRAERQDGGK